MDIIKEYEDGSSLGYDTGKFDKWCVYYINNKGFRTAPRDRDYFKDLYGFSKKYGKDRIYSDFVKIYDKTNYDVEQETLTYIEEIAKDYEQQDVLMVDKMYTTLYLAMISEERKANAVLGKRIKRLGIYTLLIENKSIEESTTFMTGKNCKILDKICLERGF